MLVANGRIAGLAEAVATVSSEVKRGEAEPEGAQIVRPPREAAETLSLGHALWQGDALAYLRALPREPVFDLVITSPPYNIGKEYEIRTKLSAYLDWHRSIIDELVPRLSRASPWRGCRDGLAARAGSPLAKTRS